MTSRCWRSHPKSVFSSARDLTRPQTSACFRIVVYSLQSTHSIRRKDEMKLTLLLICFFTLLSFAYASPLTQTFPTSAGDVRITPLNHASTLIEAGGKTIYLDPAKPAKFASMPKADLILITDIHGDHMDPDSIKDISKADTEILAPPAVVQTVTTAKPIANGETKIWQ